MDHTPLEHTIAIFDDCSTKDNTQLGLSSHEPAMERPSPEVAKLAEKLEADHAFKRMKAHDVHVFLGRNNLGVAGNSNRAIALFELLTGNDHLFLCNDDLLFSGDAASAYAKAHAELDVGLLCLNNLVNSETHRWSTTAIRGTRVKLFERMTGAVMSMTRPLVTRIGYFDTRFPQMENEHVDYTNRARLTGFMNILGRAQACIDVELTPPLVDHNHAAVPTFGGLTRQEWNRESMDVMRLKVQEYQHGKFYEPFSLRHVPYVGQHAGFDRGVPTKNLLGVEQEKSLIVPFD